MWNPFASNNQGNVLLSVMFLIGILSFVAISFSTTITNLQKQNASSKHLTSTSMDIQQMTALMKLKNGLSESALIEGNRNLFACLNGGAIGGCLKNCCKSDVETGFYYLDPADTEIKGELKRRLLGPASQASYYLANGLVCGAANFDSQECAYRISGSFLAHCPGGEASCSHAEHLRLNVKLEYNPKYPHSSVIPKDRDISFIYVNERNYRPSIEPIFDQTIYLEDAFEHEVLVRGNSGHPSELQNFLFTKCESADSKIVEVKSPVDQPFVGGIAKVKLKGVNKGTTKIKLQISDGGLEDGLSEEIFFTVQVVPGVTP